MRKREYLRDVGKGCDSVHVVEQCGKVVAGGLVTYMGDSGRVFCGGGLPGKGVAIGANDEACIFGVMGDAEIFPKGG